MKELKYTYNVNKNSIEKEGKYFAYVNVLDAHKIIHELNRMDSVIQMLTDEK